MHLPDLLGLLATTAFFKTQALHVVVKHDAESTVKRSLYKSKEQEIDWVDVRLSGELV
jgi:hypothetical protein